MRMSRLGGWLRGEWARVRGRRSAPDRSQRFDDEAHFHLEMLAQRYAAQGLSPEDARRCAQLDFGGMERFREEARDEYRSRPLEEFARDVHLAVRNLARIPAFTLTVVATLALGIGATTVVFSIVDHVVLRPLPYRDAERLVIVREVVDEIRAQMPSLPARAAHFQVWRERCGSCDEMAALLPASLVWRDGAEPVRLSAVRTSSSLFGMLGVQPVHGRLFTEEEDATGAGDVVILSHAFWLRHFAGDPAVIGRTLALGAQGRTVVGVLPPRFQLPKGNELGEHYAGLPAAPDVYVPMAFTQREITLGGNWNYLVLARLAAGSTMAQAERELSGVQAQLSEDLEGTTLSAQLVPLQQQVVGGAGRGLLLLLGAVSAVLLLVCVNLANLLLARSATRARESAVRVALGAGRTRLVRESLTESMVLALAAGAAGLLLSYWGLQLLLQLAPETMPRIHEVRLDGRVAGVGVLVALFTGLLFGTLPALRSASAQPGDVLRGGGRTRGTDRGGSRARSGLIATQVGMTAMLLTAAGVFLASFVHVVSGDTGFSPDRVLALDVTIPQTEFADQDGLLALYDGMLRELQATPGVVSVAATTKLPLEGVSWTDGVAEPGDTRPVEERMIANYHFVTNDYFRTLGIAMRAGAAFTEAERGRMVAVISERVAAHLWPGESAVGRTIQFSGGSTAEVIGVSADVTATGLEGDRGNLIYLPTWTDLGFPSAVAVAVRTSAEPAHMAGTARAAIRRAAPGAVISGDRTMAQVFSAAAAERRFQLSLLLTFAITALVTACVGIYGVIAQSLTRRRSEIGVRMALGAHRGTIHRHVMGESLRAAFAGIAAGLLAAVLLGRFIESLLYEVQPADPAVLAAVAALLSGVVAAASWLPARRATAAGPASALRQD